MRGDLASAFVGWSLWGLAMSKQRKQTNETTQLSLFELGAEEVEIAPPPRRSQMVERREMSPAEMAEKREQFFVWGKRNGFPGFKFLHTKSEAKEYSQARGEQAWRQTLLCKPMDWITACLNWLEAGETGDAHFLKLIRKARRDMLLEYAMKQGYPGLDVRTYTSVIGSCGTIKEQHFPAGKRAWMELAYSVEIEVVEAAISALVETRPTVQDIEAMRTWLLDWGKQHNYPCFGFPFHYPSRDEDKDRRYGGINYGEERWQIETRFPYGAYPQQELYPGEWLEKCIDQCKRFDSGKPSIPWQITREQDERKKESRATFEEEDF
jgi:hypothetical protein